MSYAYSISNTEGIKIYDPGENGAMGTANEIRITPLRVGSVELQFPEATTNDIRAEDVQGIIVSLPSDSDAPTLVFESLDISNEGLVKAIGGSIANGIYTPDASGNGIRFKSLALMSKPLSGKKTLWKFPYVQLFPSMDIKFVSDDIASIKLTVKILTPIDANGNPLPAWTKQDIAV